MIISRKLLVNKRVWNALVVGWLTCVGSLTIAESRAADAVSHTRDFQILVDGKERGKSEMTISRHKDGTDIMSGKANVRVKYLVYNYQYSSSGTETWKNGRLRQLESVANYGGKEYVVHAVAKGDALSIKVNGRERAARPDVWVTSYWRLPAKEAHGQIIPLVNGDTGQELRGTLEYVGAEKIKVTGKEQQVEHFRVTGGVQVDLWYDNQELLVRQDSLESGHRTVLELARIRPVSMASKP